MYAYTDFDRQFVHQRAAQYRDQLERHLRGQLPDDDFRALRLQNGWYVQRHAPMLRVAVPYGELNSKQLRALAHIAREFDRGFGHFTTRQNLQYNWIPLERSADVMDVLAAADMHGIQTSGNCIRNIDQRLLRRHRGRRASIDPRPYCEVLRQWSTLHPEFAFLPRKFKIAVSGADEDRAATAWHDIGLHRAASNDAGEVGFQVRVGGGMGRTPIIGTVIREFLPWNQILVFIEAIVRVYNKLWPPRQRLQGADQDPRQGRRPAFHRRRERRVQVHILKDDVDGAAHLIPQAELDRVSASFVQPAAVRPQSAAGVAAWQSAGRHAANRIQALAGAQYVTPHKVPGYRAGDAVAQARRPGAGRCDRHPDSRPPQIWPTAFQPRRSARLARSEPRAALGAAETDLFGLWNAARDASFATPNIGLLDRHDRLPRR